MTETAPAATGHAEPPVPLRYHQLLRAGRPGAWRPVAGTVSLVAVMVVVVPLFWQLPFALWFLVRGEPVVAGMGRLIDLGDPTPAGLAYLNLTLASAIPVTWLLVRTVHGVRPRWLASVAPRIRWRWFATCLGLSLLALVATLLVSSFLPVVEQGTSMTGRLNDFTPTLRDFALVVLLLTPLQAAGEEYAFRGYLTQAFGGIFRHPAPAVLGPALLFALAHGAQSAPVFFDRFAFGVLAGLLVILTGGLEAGIAMHVTNNFLAFGVALAYGDMGSTLNPSGGSWWSLPVTLTQSLGYLVLVLLVARRRAVRTAAEPAELVASRGAV
jgi:membrane protease YdiL (CAAX protease family)